MIIRALARRYNPSDHQGQVLQVEAPLGWTLWTVFGVPESGCDFSFELLAEGVEGAFFSKRFRSWEAMLSDTGWIESRRENASRCGPWGSASRENKFEFGTKHFLFCEVSAFWGARVWPAVTPWLTIFQNWINRRMTLVSKTMGKGSKSKSIPQLLSEPPRHYEWFNDTLLLFMVSGAPPTKGSRLNYRGQESKVDQ
jgi:hypothetical protein